MTRINDDHSNVLIELLVASGRRDRQAFSRLYRLSSPKLYAVALRILRNEASAQDCLQESFLSVWRQASSYQASRSAPMTWLTTIVRNRAIDLLRKQPTDALKMEIENRLTATTGQVELTIDSLAINKCLDELSATQRDCVVQAYYTGMTHQELASEKQLPLGTVKTWIRRALDLLRQCLQR